MRTFLAISKALSDETRVRAFLLLRDEELCLCQLIGVLHLSPSTVSKHMSILHQAGLVEFRKEGRWHYYRLAEKGASPQVRQAMLWVIKSLDGVPLTQQDRKLLQKVQNRTIKDLSQCYRK